VGPITARKLHDRGIGTVGEVAGLPEAALVSILGPAAGRHIHALAHSRDPRRVESGRRRRSLGSQRALGRRARPESELAAILDALCDRVTGRLRKGERLARTIVLRLRFDDFARATRSHTLSRPTSHTQTVRTAARSLLVTAMPLIRERGLTLLGVALSNLDEADAVQLTLPFDRHALVGLDAALDDLRERFGTGAVVRAAGLGRELGPAMPVLPD
jgi:DNA polymerase-4